MSDAPDDDSKTEEPTAKKVQDALDKGNLPLSREGPVFLGLLGLLAVFGFIARDAAHGVAGALAGFIDHPAGFRLDKGADAILLAKTVSLAVGGFVAPVLV